MIHDIGDLVPGTSEQSNLPEAFEMVTKTIFPEKPTKPTFRVVTFIVFGRPDHVSNDLLLSSFNTMLIGS